MSDTINFISFHVAVGKSRQVVLLVSEPKKGQDISPYLIQRAVMFPVAELSGIKVTDALQGRQSSQLGI